MAVGPVQLFRVEETEYVPAPAVVMELMVALLPLAVKLFGPLQLKVDPAVPATERVKLLPLQMLFDPVTVGVAGV